MEDLEKKGNVTIKLHTAASPSTARANMERKIERARVKYMHSKELESQLGLTPTPHSPRGDIELGGELGNEYLKEELGFRRRTFWKSCCGQIIDRRATQFFVQILIGSSVMMFCMLKIWQVTPVHGCEGEDTTVYFSLLSALVGFYIPSPSMHEKQ